MKNRNDNSHASAVPNENPREVLVVTSKLKHYIKDKSGMNTAGNVPEVLSDQVRRLCDQAIEKAKGEGRKTVMDRDFPALNS